MGLLDIESVILVSYCYQTAQPRASYESTDGPAGQPAGNPPNWDRVGVFRWTVPQLMARVYWQPGSLMSNEFCSNPHPDSNGRYTIVAYTNHNWRANAVNWQIPPHDNVIEQIPARPPGKQKRSKPLENCTGCDHKRSLQWRSEDERAL